MQKMSDDHEVLLWLRCPSFSTFTFAFPMDVETKFSRATYLNIKGSPFNAMGMTAQPGRSSATLPSFEKERTIIRISRCWNGANIRIFYRVDLTKENGLAKSSLHT
jgi:hypothetical protein